MDEKEMGKVIKEISVMSLKDGDILVAKIAKENRSAALRMELGNLLRSLIRNPKVRVIVLPKEVDLEVIREDENKKVIRSYY